MNRLPCWSRDALVKHFKIDFICVVVACVVCIFLAFLHPKHHHRSMPFVNERGVHISYESFEQSWISSFFYELNKTQLDSVSQRLFDSIKVIHGLEVDGWFKIVSSQNIDDYIELALKCHKTDRLCFS